MQFNLDDRWKKELLSFISVIRNIIITCWWRLFAARNYNLGFGFKRRYLCDEMRCDEMRRDAKRSG